MEALTKLHMTVTRAYKVLYILYCLASHIQVSVAGRCTVKKILALIQNRQLATNEQLGHPTGCGQIWQFLQFCGANCVIKDVNCVVGCAILRHQLAEVGHQMLKGKWRTFYVDLGPEKPLKPDATLLEEGTVRLTQKVWSPKMSFQSHWQIPGCTIFYLGLWVKICSNNFLIPHEIVILLTPLHTYNRYIVYVNILWLFQVNTNIKFEVFIHKVDGLSDDHKIGG